ncbi:PKD domain-containing protein [Tamlana fucoidanivorans]|uniref:PKD domain-containing protein n=1 Tax=Allotamlana fucoidanivorans TaxID=2583814 RepID=A0A5C4SQ49_9FLAO|nr:PKD domain-containing protein [Tamlana fucoidanivorans]TNJ46133.1 PKD domain-containing protein [Tamlana fucoidanivorans]
MRKAKLVLLMLTVFLIESCSKDDAKNTIDCLFSGLNFDVSHEVDATNSKLVMFTVTYSGDYAMGNNITWDFGDGAVEVITGNTATHEYATTGEYTVKVKPREENGEAYCIPEKKEKVTIN